MKTKHLLVTLLCCMTWFAAFSTESEPNDTKPQANTLALNGSNTGAINPATTDVDFWKIITNKDGALSVTLTIGNGLWCWVALYDNNGTTLLVSNNANTSVTITMDGLAAGTYYAKVYPYYTAQMPSYTISNSLTQAAFTNDSESNGTYGTALTLALDGSASGHVGYYYNLVRDTSDWYKVTTTGNGKLTITIASSNGQYIYANIYDGNGTTLLSGTHHTNGTLSYDVDGLAAGIYYIRVYGYYTDGFAPYTLSNTFTAPAVGNDTEPNNTKALAKVINPNASKNGQIGYYYNGVTDTADWYKLTTTGDGLVKLQFTSQNGQFVHYQLYDNNGTTLLKTHYTNGTASTSTDGLAAGTYYIKILPYYVGGFASYTLRDSTFTPAQANDTEPNGTVAQALTFTPNSTVTGHTGYYYNLVRDTFDWYKVILPTDGYLTTSLTIHNAQFTHVTIFDGDGSTQLATHYSSSAAFTGYDGLQAGTYYIRVTHYYSDGFAPYTLSNTLTTYANANDGLSNDFAKHATTLKSNSVTPGHVGFRINSGGGFRDPIDWWKINYTGTGALTVTLNWDNFLYNNGSHYVYLRVYKDTALAPLYNQYSASGSLTASLTALTKGYYYVVVVPYYSYEFAAYNLTPTFTEGCTVVTVKAKNKVSGTTCTNSSMKINCTGNNGPYRVQLYRYDLPYGAPVVANASGDAQFNQLPPGSYTGRGYADGASCGTLSAVAKLIPLPTNPFTSNITQTSVKFNWTTLTSCIEQSKVQYRVVGVGTWINKKVTSTNQFVTINGLTANTAYEWQVASVDTSAAGASTVGVYVAGPNFNTLLRLTANPDDQPTVLSVYPNPASSNVYVSFENGTEGEVTIKLFDVNGRTVFVQHQNEASGNVTEEIDLSNLITGVYQLQIITADGKVMNQSIVKSKE